MLTQLLGRYDNKLTVGDLSGAHSAPYDFGVMVDFRVKFD